MDARAPRHMARPPHARSGRAIRWVIALGIPTALLAVALALAARGSGPDPVVTEATTTTAALPRLVEPAGDLRVDATAELSVRSALRATGRRG